MLTNIYRELLNLKPSGHSEVSALRFEPFNLNVDSPILAAGTEDGAVHLWVIRPEDLQNANTPVAEKSSSVLLKSPFSSTVNSLVWYYKKSRMESKDQCDRKIFSRLLFSCSVDSKVCLWDVSRRVILQTLTFGGCVRGVSIDPRGELLIATLDAGRLSVWEMSNEPTNVSYFPLVYVFLVLKAKTYCPERVFITIAIWLGKFKNQCSVGSTWEYDFVTRK
jgi:WD40 repeat protein